MHAACTPHADIYITPMAAVAGSVADELIAFYRRPGITRAWVNNGGDIAFHLAVNQSLRVALVADPTCIALDATFEVTHDAPIRGVATSGWRGRSFSRGIADSVTVLARTGAEADAAATVIANAVDVDDSAIERRPANTLKDDSDLGAIAVTVQVPPLAVPRVHGALANGRLRALALRDRGLIATAALVCQHWFVTLDRAEPILLRERAAA